MSSPFRIATWNLDHWKRTAEVREKAWGSLWQLGIDAALLQETVPPAGADRARVLARPIGGTRPWGNAIAVRERSLSEVQGVVTRYSRRSFSMLGTFPGTVLVATHEVPTLGTITLVSLYGLIDVYAQTTMLRLVADLIPLFDSPLGEHVVLGGDFNVTTQGRESTERRRYDAIFRSVESLGLESVTSAVVREECACGGTPCRHVDTYRGAVEGPPISQLDYLFLTPELKRRCKGVRVIDEETRGLSDHAPLVAEIDTSEPLGRTAWDRESFLENLRMREGEASAATARRIFQWADEKHIELQRGGARGRFDRLPFSTRGDPEVWLQLDLEDPRALQYTFSLRGDGQVVLQFQYMRGSYASPAAREALLADLNAIPGVSAGDRATGRPKLPLASLHGDRLERFLAVWSRVVDESVRDRTPSTGPEGAE